MNQPGCPGQGTDPPPVVPGRLYRMVPGEWGLVALLAWLWVRTWGQLRCSGLCHLVSVPSSCPVPLLAGSGGGWHWSLPALPCQPRCHGTGHPMGDSQERPRCPKKPNQPPKLIWCPQNCLGNPLQSPLPTPGVAAGGTVGTSGTPQKMGQGGCGSAALSNSLGALRRLPECPAQGTSLWRCQGAQPFCHSPPTLGSWLQPLGAPRVPCSAPASCCL